jgi:hypothetical protein
MAHRAGNVRLLMILLRRRNREQVPFEKRSFDPRISPWCGGCTQETKRELFSVNETSESVAPKFRELSSPMAGNCVAKKKIPFRPATVPDESVVINISRRRVWLSRTYIFAPVFRQKNWGSMSSENQFNHLSNFNGIGRLNRTQSI